jgi:hypothetical protein
MLKNVTILTEDEMRVFRVNAGRVLEATARLHDLRIIDRDGNPYDRFDHWVTGVLVSEGDNIFRPRESD